VAQERGVDGLRRELEVLFPLPGAAEKTWLYRALIRIQGRGGWLGSALESVAPQGMLAEALRQVEDEVPASHRGARVTMLKGEFGLAGAMIGGGASVSSPELDLFRGLLWLAMTDCHRSGETYLSAAEGIASAVRSALSSSHRAAAVALIPVLSALKAAPGLGAAVDALGLLASSDHDTLEKAWTGWWRDALLRILESRGDGRPAPPGPQPLPPPPPPAPSGPRVGGPRKRDGSKPDPGHPDVIVLRPIGPPAGEPLLPGESPAEFSLQADLVVVPGQGAGLTQRQVRFRAMQAVWSRNPFLLECHIDALSPPIFGAALRDLTRVLIDTNAPHEARMGAFGALVVALTGTTDSSLDQLRLGDAESQVPLRHRYLDLEQRCIWVPVAWKLEDEPSESPPGQAIRAPAYFKPNEHQRRLVVPVLDRFPLPLPPSVADAFHLQVEDIRRFFTAAPDERHDWVYSAVEALSGSLGIPMRVANLRRSIPPVIVGHCGDPVVAQLITADTLGRPESGLSYYAPKVRTITQIYRDALVSVIGDDRWAELTDGDERVGSELYVDPKAAKRLASASAEHEPVDGQGSGDRAAVLLAHRRILDHTVRMTVATAGHRPAEALFELTLADLGLESGAALFRDKRHDVAHDPRLAALPKVLVHQLKAYLEHLEALAERWPNLRPHVRDVQRGEGELLFDLNADGAPCRPSFAAIRERGPELWKVLPWNWGRTYWRTRSVEMGMRPFLASVQLGHYDLVGYPYASESPTTPIEVVEHTRPWLDRVAATQGWTVLTSPLTVHGRPRIDKANGAPALPPLRDWYPLIKAADRRLDGARLAWERQLLVDQRAERKNALDAVLAHDAFAASGLAAAFADPSIPVTPEAIDALNVERIRDELVVTCGDTPGRAVARVRALKKVVGRLAQQAQHKAPPIPIPVAVRRPIENPFFQGALLALTQMEALRRHVDERSRQKKPVRTFPLQVARTFEALVLFGGLDSRSTALEVIAARHKAVRSAKIHDLILVPIASGRVIQLRGLASMAIASLAKSFPDDPLPEISVISAGVQSLLPEWAAASTRGALSLLDVLCSVAAVANRFEMSPAMRFALDGMRGCIGATLEEQLAYIDGDLSPPTFAPPDSDEGADAPLRANAPATEGQKSAHSQFRILSRMIPRRGKSLKLPLQGLSVPATSIHTEATRDLVSVELDRWLALDQGRDPLRPIIRLLGEWTRATWEGLKRNGKPRAFNTVHTYLTRIGGALVEELGDSDWHELHEDALENAYAYVLSLPKKSRHKVAAQLLSFHRYSEGRLDCPEIDLSEVHRHLRTQVRNVDAVMLLPVHRERALLRIADLAKGALTASPSETRIARQADALSYFLAYGGARFSEAGWLQLRDVAPVGDDRIHSRVRPNRGRTLKTFSARRHLVFDPGSAEHALRVRAWCESVRTHHGPTRPDGAYVFAELDDARAFGELDAAGRLIRRSLAEATGRRTERQHRLRHLVAVERLSDYCWSSEDANCIGRRVDDGVASRPLEPRDFARIAVPLGHAHWGTTLGSYIHVPAILQSRFADQIRTRWMGRTVAAGVLGVTPAQMDDIRRGRTHEDAIKVWMDHFIEARLPDDATPLTAPLAASPPATKPVPLSCALLGAIFRHAEKADDLIPALSLVGASTDVVETLVARVSRWERVLGYRLLPSRVGGRPRVSPRRAIRRFKEDESIEAIWEQIDAGQLDRKDIKALSDAYFQFGVPDEEHAVVLPTAAAETLDRLLQQCGIQGASIQKTPLPGDLVSTVVLRSKATDRRGRFMGLAVKRVLAVAGIAMELAAGC